MKHITFAVTTDLNYDQRMQRICTALSRSGYAVTLIGRAGRQSADLSACVYRQRRIRCYMNGGFGFYAEYNVKLFFLLLRMKTDAYCAIDLDTILPVYFASVLRRKKRFYDAHELFTEMKELVTRPRIHHFWKKIERFSIPRFPNGYTVCQSLADIFRKEYGVNYAVVRNVAAYYPLENDKSTESPFLLYQGSVNVGRGFESLIPAMCDIDIPLRIYGRGNYVEEVKKLIAYYHVEDRVFLMGPFLPADLRAITQQAYIGILLMDTQGLNNYYSLANRFTDYMMAGLPQVCVGFPEYHRLNALYGFAELLPDLDRHSIVLAVNKLLEDPEYYQRLKENALKARKILNWEEESKILLQFYRSNL